jgi:hypothetical protein
LLSGLPDPKDAFDADELPLHFILRRDSGEWPADRAEPP